MCQARPTISHFILLYNTIICSKFEFQRYTTYFWSWCNFYSKGCKRTMTFHTTIAQNEARERNSQVPNFHAIWGITKTSFPFSIFNLKSIYFFYFFKQHQFDWNSSLNIIIENLFQVKVKQKNLVKNENAERQDIKNSSVAASNVLFHYFTISQVLRQISFS